MNSCALLDMDEYFSMSKQCFVWNKVVIAHFISSAGLNNQKQKVLETHSDLVALSAACICYAYF